MSLPARECFRGWMHLLKDRYELLLGVNLLVYIGKGGPSQFYSLLMLLLRRWKQCAAPGRQLLAQMRFPWGSPGCRHGYLCTGLWSSHVTLYQWDFCACRGCRAVKAKCWLPEYSLCFSGSSVNAWFTIYLCKSGYTCLCFMSWRRVFFNYYVYVSIDRYLCEEPSSADLLK